MKRFVCLGVLALTLMLCGCNHHQECGKVISEPGVNSLHAGWDFLVDYDAAANGTGGMTLEEAVAASTWKPWFHEEGWMARSQAECFWYRNQLPDKNYSDPALFFEGGIFQNLEVYIDGQPIFKSDEFGPFLSRYAFEHWYVISLPPDSGGKEIYLKICAPRDSFIGFYSELSLYGSQMDMISHLLRSSMPTMFVGVFLTFAGIYSGLLALLRRRSKYFSMSMGGMMFCYGLFMVCGSSGLLQLYVKNPMLNWYLTMVPFMLFPVGLWRYVEHLVGAGYVKMIRRFWQFHLLMTVAVVAIDLAGQHVAMLFIFMAVTVALCVENFSVLYMLAKHLKTGKDRIFRLLMGGMLVLNITGILEVLEVFDKIGPLAELWVFREIFSVGLLIFVGILIYIQERMFMDAEQQVQEHAMELSRYSEGLEELVEERTRELVSAKEKAEAADRSKSDFLAHMSHELRTPLNAILGYAQLFRKDAALTGEQKAKIDIMYESGNHLLGMINDVLDLSKIEAGEMALETGQTDLRQLLQQIGNMVRIKAEEKGLDLVCDFDDALPVCIECDSKRLKQVLINILGNAVKYTEHGRITWCVTMRSQQAAGCEIEFAVTDTGIGIAEKDLIGIFDPFQRAHADQQVDGSGLGLAISRNLLRSMNSELSVQSTVGEGSTFGFVLKVTEKANVVPLASSARSEEALDGTNIRLLIVDDRQENLELLAGMLQPYGFTVFCAQNGDQAIKTAQNNVPDMILMDLLMPELDGFQTIDVLRYELKNRDVKMIAVSASVHEKVKEKALLHGFDAFLPKPVVMEDLERLLKSFLEQKMRKNGQIYAENDQKTSGNDKKRSKIDKISLPYAEKREKLKKIVKTGDINLILSEIAVFEAEFPDFAKKCRELAQNFHLKRLEHFLDGKISS